jgi:hypothetical protein
VTSYNADILPLFRPRDIQCMSGRGVLLDQAAWMTDPAGDARFADHANARLVAEQIVQQSMPPDRPWPAEEIARYQDWMAGGFAS